VPSAECRVPSAECRVPSAWLVCLVCAWLMLLGVCSEASALVPPAAVKNLAAWYDASDNTTLSTTVGGVSQWNDKSGNGETLVQTISANQPSLLTNSINGLSALYFSGTWLQSNDTNFSRLLLPNSTVFIVENSAGAQNSEVFASRNGGNMYILFLPYSGNYLGFGSNTSPNYVGGGGTSSGPHLFTALGTISGSYEALLEDGTILGSTNSPSAAEAATFSCPVTVGTRFSGCTSSTAYYYTGSVGEIIVYNFALTQAQYQLVEGVLACKWGLQANLPSTHPYASTCPSGTESTNLNSISGATTGPSAWYDASDLTTITTSGGNASVSQITDKSRKGNTLTQSTQSAQPYVTTISGQQALEFSGGQQLVSSTSNTFATGSNPSSVFVVAAWTGSANTSWGHTMSYGGCGTGQGRGFGKANGSQLLDIAECNQDLYSSSSSWGSTLSIGYGQYGSTTEFNAMNGGVLSSKAAVPNTPSGTSFYLGSWLGSQFWIGPIYELVYYNSALSTAEQQFIEGYLACKWGLQSSLPSSHPYKSTCPATATPNLTLVAAVSPTGNQPPGTVLTYTTTYTNNSGTIAYNPTFSAVIPAHTDFQVGSLTSNAGSTGLSYVASYSSDGGSTWTYTPTSGAGGAASGYDRTVTNIRWVLSGALAPGSGVNSGTVGFAIKIQ